MNYEALDEVLEKVLTEINQYCISIHSKVVFLGHVESPELLIYPHLSVMDPIGVSVNISSMGKGKKKDVLKILAKNGISATFGRDKDSSSIEFIGTLRKEGKSHD